MFRQVAIFREFITKEYKNIPSVDTIKCEILRTYSVQKRFLKFHP
jgi:hypothetical protein